MMHTGHAGELLGRWGRRTWKAALGRSALLRSLMKPPPEVDDWSAYSFHRRNRTN